MAKGVSLHVGLNYVDPNHYKRRDPDQAGKYLPWNGELRAAEADALAMCQIAENRGFNSTKLLREKATRQGVIGHIVEASAQLVAGDIFFISYAGHGNQIPDTSGDEGDGLDETWCLYDGQLIDDELLVMWSQFKPGVRVLIVSDSCHSGTVNRGGNTQELLVGAHVTDTARSSGASAATNQTAIAVRYRFMPRSASNATFLGNRDFYDEIKRNIPGNIPDIKASVKLLSGCRDDQFAKDGDENGFFTSTLLKVWQDGKFDGDYHRLFEKIHDKMTHWWTQFQMETKQEPRFDEFGPPDPGFKKPFTI